MKLVRILSALGAAAVAVYAQGTPPPVPECAEGCIQGGLGSSACDPTDFKCQCADTGALTTVMGCVKARCQPGQIPGIIAAASAICAEYGGTDISDVLKSIVSSGTSSTVAGASSRTTTVSGSQEVLSPTATTSTATQTSAASKTFTIPSPTESLNGSGKNTIGGCLSIGVPVAGLVAVYL
ncbi:hypothetical protein TWF718_010021 [Orbilia javanica]|uniref:CFEM domain-containing protein n=1 Tax=Orbilia javanica TaxID=47235 RepID=A0AAN8RFH3_9PEZI